MLLPDAYQASAQWTAKAAAHALFTYVLQETAFQTEWASMFPSHKILGERGARGAGVSDFDFDADASEFDLDAFIDDIPHATEAPTAKHKRSPGEDEKAVERELRDLPVPSRHEVPISSLPPDLRREVYRIHRNLGHPERAAFCKALKINMPEQSPKSFSTPNTCSSARFAWHASGPHHTGRLIW